MPKLAKVAAFGVGALVVLVLALLSFILFVIDPNDYKPDIYKVVKDKTDMDLVISDRIEWRLWPDIGLKLGKTSLSDTQAKQTLFAVNRAEVSVQVMPLLSKQIAIDSVRLDGARLSFSKYANGSTSWDRMLNKLKNQPKEESEKIAFNVKLLDINNGALDFRDELSGTSGRLDKLLVQATDIDLNKAFPVHVKFAFQQTDRAGKTLVADNDLNATIRLDQDAERYTLKGLTARSHLQGTALPAPMIVDVQGDVLADMKQQRHSVDGLKLALDYQDPKLKAPAHADLQGKVVADMKQQVVNVTGLALDASYPDATLKAPATVTLRGDVQANLLTQLVQVPALALEAAYPAANLKSPATVKLNAAVNADLKQQLVSLTGIKADAAYPDPTRPAPVTATMTGALSANLASGALNFAPLDLQASVSDKAFPKVMPVHLTAPITANWKEGKVALNGFSLDALSIQTKGQLQASLPALRADAKPGTPATQGMTLSGNVATSPFNLRQLMQDLGMAAPAMKDPNTLKHVSLSSQITGSEKSVMLSGLKAKLDDSTLSGDVGITDLATKRLYARLNIDTINVDRYMAPADPKAKPSSGDLLPVDLLKQQNLDAQITIGSLTALNYPVRQLRIAATANGGVVDVKQLGGSVLSGSFNLPTTIDVRGAQPVLSVQPNIQQVDIANLVQLFTKKDLLAGKAAFQGSLKLSGNSVQAWTNSVSGASTLKLDDGVLKGVNLTQLVLAEMGKYQAYLPLLTGKDSATIASKQNDTKLNNFVGQADIRNGLVQTKALNADLQKAKIEGGGNFNLATLEADYTFKLSLDKSIVGEGLAKYPFPVRCKGSVSAPASLCSVDSRAVRDMATTALLESEKVQKLKADLEAKKTEAQAKVQAKLDEQTRKATEKLDEQTKKATDKVGEKLNEQLQKLFKH